MLAPEPPDGRDQLLHERPDGFGIGAQGFVLGEPGRLRPRGSHDRLADAEALPDLLGHERHHRMQEAERPLEDPGEDGGGVIAHDGVLGSEPLLLHLETPVAELRPEEPVHRLGGRRELVAVQRRVHLGDAALVPREEPALRRRQPFVRRELRLPAVERLQHEPGGVPDLVREVAPALDRIHRERDVLLPAGRESRQREPQGVGPVEIEDLDGVDHVAERLGHLPAVRVAHEPVDHDVSERDVARE